MSRNTIQLNLVVVRSLDPASTVAFYQRLGLSFQQEKHGNGPVHWSSNMGNLIFEVYPANDDNKVDKTTRLGFTILDAESVLSNLRSTDVEIVSDLKLSEWGLRAVVRDSDGRSRIRYFAPSRHHQHFGISAADDEACGGNQLRAGGVSPCT